MAVACVRPKGLNAAALPAPSLADLHGHGPAKVGERTPRKGKVISESRGGGGGGCGGVEDVVSSVGNING